MKKLLTCLVLLVVLVVLFAVFYEGSRLTADAEVEGIVNLFRLSPSDIEELTLKKFSSISEELLDSSLTPKDRQRVEAAGFSDALAMPFVGQTDEERFSELEEEILRNPIYGITVAKAVKALRIKDRTLGEINPWLDDLSDKKEEGLVYWLEYRPGFDKTIFVTSEYRSYAAALCVILERMICVGVQKKQTAVNWALNYTAMNNDRMGSITDYQYALPSLVFVYRYKNGDEVFSIGFNLKDKRPEIYGETEPVTEPETEPVTEPSTEPPTEPVTEPETEPVTEPSTEPEKNPELASYEYVEPNDDPGPGPDTNAGEGAVYSPEDQDTNSNHMSDYEEYVEAIEELEIVNESQKTGDDDNTPSYTPPVEYVTNPAEPEAEPETLPPSVIDNNGDTGNTAVEAVVVNEVGEEEIVEIGTAAPIDEPTPIQPPAAIVGGEPITEPAGEWGGPPD